MSIAVLLEKNKALFDKLEAERKYWPKWQEDIYRDLFSVPSLKDFNIKDDKYSDIYANE